MLLSLESMKDSVKYEVVSSTSVTSYFTYIEQSKGLSHLHYFLRAYINGLRSFGHNSHLKAAELKSKKRASTGKWVDALAKAEHAHVLLREAAVLAQSGKFQEVKENATKRR